MNKPIALRPTSLQSLQSPSAVAHGYRGTGRDYLIQMSTPNALVQKLWNYCNVLRDDRLSFRLHPLPARQDGGYVEQFTFLLFLKMANEQTRPLCNEPSPIRFRQALLQKAFTGELQ